MKLWPWLCVFVLAAVGTGWALVELVPRLVDRAVLRILAGHDNY